MRREEGGGEGEMEGESHKLEHLVVLEEVHYPRGEAFYCIILLLHHPAEVQLDITHCEWGKKGGREGGREEPTIILNMKHPQTFLLIGTAGAWTRLKLLRERVICSNHLNSPSMPRLAKSSLARWYKWELFNSACTEDETSILT